jgi:hypothetical protein
MRYTFQLQNQTVKHPPISLELGNSYRDPKWTQGHDGLPEAVVIVTPTEERTIPLKVGRKGKLKTHFSFTYLDDTAQARVNITEGNDPTRPSYRATVWVEPRKRRGHE